MIPAIAAFWVGLPKWLQDVLKIFGFAALVFVVGKTVAEALKAEGARKQREKDALKRAEIKVAVNERTTKIIEEERTHADEAIRARDTSPLYPTPDVMPDDLRRVTFGDKRGS